MAKGKKTGGRDFKKGVVTNPNGRPRVPDDLKAARLMYAHDVEAAIYKYGSMGLTKLKEAFGNPETPSRDLAIIKILIEAIVRGDQQRLDFIFNRSIGKVRDQVDLAITRPSILVKTDGTEVHFTNEMIEGEK